LHSINIAFTEQPIRGVSRKQELKAHAPSNPSPLSEVMNPPAPGQHITTYVPTIGDSYRQDKGAQNAVSASLATLERKFIANKDV
jgi:hypothetical protein